MKRIFTLLGAFLFIISFFACSVLENNHVESTESLRETTVESTTDNARYIEQRIEELRLNHSPTWEARFFMSRGFDQQIRQTPIIIDLALFDAENDMRMANAELYDRFTEYWQIELSHVLYRLYRVLDVGEAEMLREEQLLWESFIDISMTLNSAIYSAARESQSEDSFEQITISHVRLYETRKRTLELMEYYYRLAGEIVFVFEG